METDADNYRRALASNDVSPAREMAQRYSTDMGLVVTADSTNERLIGRALLRLLAAKSEETAQRLRDEVYRYQEKSDGAYLDSEDWAPGLELEYDGDTAPLEPKKTPYRPPAAIQPEWDRVKKQPPHPEDGDVSMTFSEAWSETVADLVTNKTWDAGKAAHADSSRKLWVGIIGDTPLDAVSQKMAIRFRRAASQLPETYHRDKRWRDMPLLEIIADADALEVAGTKFPRMTVKTVNRHISQLKQMWIQFTLLAHVAKERINPFDRLHLTVKKTRAIIRAERDQC